MIRIGLPRIENGSGRSRLVADISLDDVVYPLWFEVESHWGKYLCHERSDAFLIGLLHYAMSYGHDIVCEGPVTRRLYESLTEQFLPAYYKINQFAHTLHGYKPFQGYRTRIKAPLADEIEHPEAGNIIGTGCSCGVDSMHVFAAHPDVMCGCIWNLHGVTYQETENSRKLGWDNIRNHAEEFCKYVRKSFLVGNTNYDRNSLPGLQFDGSTTYGNLFCVFALQKLWSKYYIASGYDIDDFHLKGTVRDDPAHYEYLLFSILQLGKLRVCLDGVALRRIDKVRDLIRYEPSYHFLNVCWGINEGNKNCSCFCPKCMRTMLNLDAHDSLDLYHEVFDVAYYRAHFEQYLAELYRGYLQGNPFMLEMKDYFIHKRIPFSIRIRTLWICFKKGFRKVLRGGSVNHGKFTPS